MVKDMDIQVARYGGSLVLVLPPRQVKALGIVEGEIVRVRVQRMQLVPVGEVEKVGRRP